jgi:hypothetical protein
MLKKFARWILREELKIIDEMQFNQLKMINNKYTEIIKTLNEQHQIDINCMGKTYEKL